MIKILRVLLVTLFCLLAVDAPAQYTPPNSLAYVWNPISSQWQAVVGSGTPVTGIYPPAPVALYCVDGSGNWVKATTSGNCFGSSGGVTQIVAGSGISVSPSGGTGIVTVNAAASALASQQFVSSATAAALGLLNQAPAGNAPVWNRISIAVDPRLTSCGSQDAAQERAMMYEASAPIVAGQPFEMWYHSAWSTPQISLATSIDGTRWNCQGVVLSGQTMPRHVWRDGSNNVTFYTVDGTNALNKNVSANGQTGWTTTATNLTNLSNPYVWQENNQTFVLFTRHTTCWQTYFAYSTDGLTGLNFAEYSGNPIVTSCATGSAAGYKDVSNNYWLWMQSTSPFGTVADTPNDLYFFKCTGFVALSPSCSVQNSSNPVISRKTSDEGVSYDADGQIADPALVTDGTPAFSGTPSVLANKTIMTYEAIQIQAPTAAQPALIKESIANMSLAQLVTTAQSDGPPSEPDTSAGIISTNMFLPATPSKPVVIGSGNSVGTIQYGEYAGTDRLMIGANLYFSSTSATQTRPNTSLGSAFTQAIASASNDGTIIGNYITNLGGGTTGALILAQDSGGSNAYFWDFTNFLCLGSEFSCPVSLSSRGATAGPSGTQPWFVFGNGTSTDTSAFLDFSNYRNKETGSLSGYALPGYANFWDDSTSHRPKLNYNGGPDVTLPVIVAQGTSTMSASVLLTNTCATAVSTGATNAATTDTISWSYASTPTSSDALLTVTPYMSSGNVNFIRCNASAVSITPSALVINWSVIR